MGVIPDILWLPPLVPSATVLLPPLPAASGAGALLLILHVGQAADDCRGLWVWCLAARGLSLPGVEDKPRQEASRPRRPLCSPPAGSCQTFPPSRGEWEQLRP